MISFHQQAKVKRQTERNVEIQLIKIPTK